MTQRIRKEAYTRELSLKMLERPKIESSILKNAPENPLDTSQKMSPTINPSSPEQPKYVAKSKLFDFQLQTGRHVETKPDSKFFVNPALTAVTSANLIQPAFSQTKTRWKSTSNNKFLPKLISKAFDSSTVIRRNRMGNFNDSIAADKTQTYNETYRISVERLEERDSSPRKSGIQNEDDNSYRSFLVEEPRKEEDLRKLVSKMKAQMSTMRWKITHLEKENHELKEQVQTLKNALGAPVPPVETITSEKLRQQEKSPERAQDSEDGSRSPSPRIRNKSPLPLPTSVKPVDAGLNFRLGNIFRNFTKFRSLYYTLDSVVIEACKIFDCRYTRILLTSERAKRVYNDSGSEKIKTDKITIGGDVRADLIQKNDDNIMDYELPETPETVADIKKSFPIDARGLSFPIFSVKDPEEFYGAIQIVGAMTTTKHDRSPRKKGFAQKDELLLETFCKILALLIDSHYRDWIVKEIERRESTYNDAISHLITTRTHQDLLEIIKLRFGDHFGFEHMGLLFFENKENVLFTFDTHRKQDGRYYNTDAIRFSARAGISGYLVNHNVDMISLNEPRKNKYFQPEIDNVAGAPAVKNLIVALLKDKNGHRVGILQLVNKSDFQDIDAKDEMMVRALQRLLGALIAHIADVDSAVALSIALKKNVKNIEETFAS